MKQRKGLIKVQERATFLHKTESPKEHIVVLHTTTYYNLPTYIEGLKVEELKKRTCYTNYKTRIRMNGIYGWEIKLTEKLPKSEYTEEETILAVKQRLGVITNNIKLQIGLMLRDRLEPTMRELTNKIVKYASAKHRKIERLRKTYRHG